MENDFIISQLETQIKSPRSADYDPLLTPAEVAKILKVSTKLVYKAVALGHLKAVPVASLKRIRISELKRWLRSQNTKLGTSS